MSRKLGAPHLAGVLLAFTGSTLPSRRHWPYLLVVIFGIILGFPLLTTLALQTVPAVHAVIITGVLPIATAIAAVWFAHERPSCTFWLASLAGFACVVVFALVLGAGSFSSADWLLLLAVIVCAAGYAAGGVLSKEMGGLWVICWALVICIPVSVPASLWLGHRTDAMPAGGPARAGMLYLAIFSQFIGFYAWYKGLAKGGVARIGQLKLAQPVISLILAALILSEAITLAMILAGSAVLFFVILTQRVR